MPVPGSNTAKFYLLLSLVTCFQLATLNAQELLSKADALYDAGDLKSVLQSAELYAQQFKADPKSYEAAWKASRSYRQYANDSKEAEVEGWKDICKQNGQLGMSFGEKAVALNPKGVEGYFWYGCSVGNYSDGVSVVTALREGLKGKTQENLEKAYELDKTYRDGGPIKAIGRFWFVLPWPLTDKVKALNYLQEFQKLYPEDPEGQVFLAEVLIDRREKAEAKKLLEKAAASDQEYYAELAKKLLKDL